MTVDMLAATFFWPEAVAPGPAQSPMDPSDDEGLPVGPASDLGLWAAVKRFFARTAWAENSTVQV